MSNIIVFLDFLKMLMKSQFNVPYTLSDFRRIFIRSFFIRRFLSAVFLSADYIALSLAIKFMAVKNF